MTVYYFAPDLERPSGGVRTIYRHVDGLNAVGLEAAVVHARRGFRCTWFDNATRIEHLPIRLDPSDVVVLPEQHVKLMTSLAPGIRKVVFNQNPYRTFGRNRDLVGAAVAPYTECPDLVGVLVVSDDSERYLQLAFPSLRIRKIQHHIDAGIYHGTRGVRAQRIVAMPRKREADLAQLLGLLRQPGVLDGWEVVLLAGRSESDVAAALRTAPLFVSLSHAEGFGLPPAEAIACGCHVIGYHGMGGREYLRAPFATPIEDGDVVELACAVMAFLRTYGDRHEELARLGEEGSAWIHARYSGARQTADLVGFFGPLLQEPPPAGARPVLVRARALRHEPATTAYVKQRLISLGKRVTGA
jgi:hypothetical protein